MSGEALHGGKPRRPLGVFDRAQKLRAMSPGELWTRVRYGAYCYVERGRHARGAFNSAERLRAALAPALAREGNWRRALLESRLHRRANFFAGADAVTETRRLFLQNFTAEVARARVEADRALRHEFAFFGGTYHYNGRVDWHADPVSRAVWPKVYHRDVPVHGGDVGFGDVKHVWELGRHQFLIDLAKGWVISQDRRYALAIRELVADWRAQNPVGTGVAWSCSLEPAFRALSWLWAYYLTLDDLAEDVDGHLNWLEGFREHGWFLYRHLEYYTSPYNHLAGEACALYCLGVLFPEFSEAPKWRAHGRHVLESRLPSQFYADGGSVEQSTFYHHATTGFYLLAALLGRCNGEEFSSAVWAALERAVAFSMLLQQPDGTVPKIGGADDGKPIRLEQRTLWDFRPYQAIGAVIFNRGDFKAAAGSFWEDALWLLGSDGAARFDAIAAQPPSPSHVLDASGYVVLRDRWASNASYLCFDCGEQAAGLRRDAIASAAHGHADCLSIVLWRRGQPVLVDAGLYCYNGPKAWQDHFRETAAHNTVRIDGRDQARHINKMAWSHTYTATIEGHDLAGPSGPWAVASHDGYRALPSGGAIHRRAVWMRKRGDVIVCDLLEGTGEHHIEVTFQFAPGRLDLAEDHALFDDRVMLHWFAPVSLAARVREGGSNPEDGWIAASLGVKVGAPRLVLSTRMTLPATIVTVFSDTLPETPAVSRSTSSRGGTIDIRRRAATECLVIPSLGETTPFATDALMAAWIRQADRVTSDGRVGGSFQRVNG